MVKASVAGPTVTGWASLVVIEPKKDRDLHFRVYCRQSNAVTVRDRYSIPRMDECIDFIGEEKLFSILNAISRFWQIEMN